MRKSSAGLEREIEEGRRQISTERYGMSLGELTSMYQDGDLIVHPEFQRFFRWDDQQKSRLVESILLGIPLPPIFVATIEDGKWELVDGLQRVSTLLELQGVLLDKDGEKKDPLVLEGTKFLPALDGMGWSGDTSLSDAQQRDIKRARIDVQIIKRESTATAKYDLFQRLNSYGSQLTAQELRSCMLVAVNSRFLAWCEELASFEAFDATVQLPENREKEQYKVELVLRFLALHNWQAPIRQSDLKNFSTKLDDLAISMAETFPKGKPAMERVFKQTFTRLNDAVGEDVFRRWDGTSSTYTGAFLNTSYEVFAMGLGYLIANGVPIRKDLRNAVWEFWDNTPGNFATGLSTEVRLARFMPQGRDLLSAPVDSAGT